MSYTPVTFLRMHPHFRIIMKQSFSCYPTLHCITSALAFLVTFSLCCLRFLLTWYSTLCPAFWVMSRSQAHLFVISANAKFRHPKCHVVIMFNASAWICQEVLDFLAILGKEWIQSQLPVVTKMQRSTSNRQTKCSSSSHSTIKEL